MQANLGSPLHLKHSPAPCPGPTPPRATHSFVIGLLLLELLHHDAPLLVLAPLVLKPDPDHAGAEARHLHQLLLHECVWPGVGGIAGPQGVELLLVQHSSNAGGLLGLFVDVGPQGWLPGGDGLSCKARGTVSVGLGISLLPAFPCCSQSMASVLQSQGRGGDQGSKRENNTWLSNLRGQC